MPRYVIEREIPDVGAWSAEQFRDVSALSCQVLDDLGGGISWLHSYVTGDKIYCVYDSPNAELILEHAQKGGFPANSISEVVRMISPATAGE